MVRHVREVVMVVVVEGLVWRTVVVVVMVVVTSTIGHGDHGGGLPGQSPSVWDCVVRLLWCGAGRRRGRVLGGAGASQGLFAVAGVLGQRVPAAQDHVHVLVDGYGLEHLHHVSVSLPQHTVVVDVNNHITYKQESRTNQSEMSMKCTT